MSYTEFKTEALQHSSDGIVTVQGVKNPFGVQCVNVPRAYAAHLWPNVPFAKTISMGDARTLFDNASSQYFQKFANDPSDAGQLPQAGDVMVFDATPRAGYINQFDNPDGHTGICDGANTSGYDLLQENAPQEGQGVNVTHYAWNYRPCIGWLRPINVTEGDDVQLVDENMAADLAAGILFREGSAQTDPDYLKSVVGQPVATVIASLVNSAEHKSIQADLIDYQKLLKQPGGLTKDQKLAVSTALSTIKTTLGLS